MLDPSINHLLEKVDSRYTLVVVASKRAREIIDAGEKLTKGQLMKPVTVATHEIANDKIDFIRPELEK